MRNIDELVKGLNNKDGKSRLANLRGIRDSIDRGIYPKAEDRSYVNNHIHTTYSFSPYSPTKALWMAYSSGLTTAGIMDHDSISGAREFIEAGEIMGMATTIGIECRVDFSGTPLKGRRINNPDQKSIAYMALHGIPHTQIERVTDYFAPYREERNKRNELMVQNINHIFKDHGIELSFHEDVVPLSMSREGGSITERHLLYALSLKLIESYGKGPALVEFLTRDMDLPIKPAIKEHLSHGGNEFYEYDLLGLLKSDLVEKLYVDATLECPKVDEVIEFSKEIGAISAYAYLGDVVDSVTGDKKAQKFEDDYLDTLFQVIKDLGFDAVTYMPTRNTREQLQRLKGLCASYDLFEISGEDVNSPRQSFICDVLRDPAFENLVDSTWALIGHELAATRDIEDGMFSPRTIRRYPNLQDRIRVYKEIGIKGSGGR